MRHEVTTWLETLDEDFLSAVHAMVGTYVSKRKKSPVLGYEADGTAVTADEFLRQADEAMAAVDRGEYTTLEELDKESATWLERTE